MDKRQRAERLIASLRWLVMVLGVAAVSDEQGIPRVALLAGVVAAYNSVAAYCAADHARFLLHGRKISLLARVMDTVVVTIVVGTSGSNDSLTYLLYWFVLISHAYSSASVRALPVATVGILLANSAAMLCSMSAMGSVGSIWGELALRNGVIVLGFLVSAYIAKCRSQDDLASERGSYLHALLNCGARLTSFREVHELALYVLSSSVTETNASGGELMLANDATRELACEAFHNAGGDSASPPDPLLRSYANWVLGTGRELCVHTGGKAAEITEDATDDRPAIAVPLLWQASGVDGDASVLGVLIVWGHSGESFGDDAVDILRIFAAMATSAIVNLRLYNNMQRSFLSTLQTLANGLEARDEYTRGHSERVTQVSCILAQELGVASENAESLRNAALLHDIGKIGVPDAILRKAGKLTAEEWEAMRRHPVVSADICRPLGLQQEVMFLIEHHQERLDGKGYPSGLPAQDQPLLLRILVVADSFDAMRSRRPYRDMMPREELLSELNRSAGRTLDPTVVEALKRVMDSGDLDAVYEEHDRAIGEVMLLKKAPRQKAA